MTTSGTYAYNPSLGELTIFSFNLCGIRATALLQEHMESARMATNMLLGRWSSQGVNLCQVDLQTIPLIQGQTTYSVDPSTISMLDAYIVQNADGSGNNRILLPISRSEYASYPNISQQGQPTVYWFDRLLAPTVTLWPVPDGNEAFFNFYRLRQSQDAGFSGGQTLQIPVYFIEALAFGLAARLAVIWAPDKAVMLKTFADEAYEIAATQNVETAQIYISPMISSYFSP